MSVRATAISYFKVAELSYSTLTFFILEDKESLFFLVMGLSKKAQFCAAYDSRCKKKHLKGPIFG
jgi:hypothetical protein